MSPTVPILIRKRTIGQKICRYWNSSDGQLVELFPKFEPNGNSSNSFSICTHEKGKKRKKSPTLEKLFELFLLFPFCSAGGRDAA